LAFVNLIGGLDCEVFRSGNAKMIILVQINNTENGTTQTRSALTIASNTGWASAGERRMMLSTSLVAVCC
jgi:hypothetical protein